MRLSMLAVIAVAVLIGLGVVFAVRTMGLLNPPAAPPPPAVFSQPPPPAAPPAPPSVVVPVRHLFAGDTISPADVRVRQVRPEELKDYEAKRGDFVTAVPEQTYFRYTARDVVADTPLQKADLQAVKKPEALSLRLLPGTRAVSVAVQKE